MTVAWIDTETTGLDPNSARMISFAGIVTPSVTDLTELRRLDVRIQPEISLETEAARKAIAVNGYREEDWVDALPQRDAILAICEFLNGTEAVVGQNVGFDLSFIDRAKAVHGVTIRTPYHKVDLVTLAYVFLKPEGLKNLSLSKPDGICDFLGIPIVDAHTAMGDVLLTQKAFQSVLIKYGP